jgi:glycosyltransferase involved in cell wall biosynthesis
MAEEIDAAVPYTRGELGLPADAVALATFGRLEKCATDVYISAMAQILATEPKAWLLLAGSDAFNVMPDILRRLGSSADRVRYLGQRQADGPRLVKSVDVYCDTYPWTGGQSLVDAMQAGRAVVAMHRANDPYLDPTGVSAFTGNADVLMTGVTELAPAGDIDAYVRIARAYVGDPELRAAHGLRLRDKVVRDCNVRTVTKRFADNLQALIVASEQPNAMA